MGISSAGIGSGIDVETIISKLMAAEAQPRFALEKKTAANQTKLTALGTLSSAVGTFQGALSSLTSLSSLQPSTTNSTNTDVMVGSATSAAQAGTYKINVTQVAQAQTLASPTGRLSKTAAIGDGTATTVSFQLGAISGGGFGLTGATLPGTTLASGITPGALTINGTVIATDSNTKTTRLLADAINAKSETTGVSATESTASGAALFGAAGASTFGAVDTSGGGTYSLEVGGVSIASQVTGVAAGAGVTAAGIDTILAGGAPTSAAVASALASAGITFTGTAALGTLSFANTSGAAFSLDEVVGGSVTGGIGKAVANVPNETSVTLFSPFSPIDTSGNGTYALQVGGVTIASQGAGVAGAAGLDSAGLDAILVTGTDPTSAAVLSALTSAGITVSGTASFGDLQFKNASGTAFSLQEVVGGVVGGVMGGIGIGGAVANPGSSVAVAATAGTPVANAGTSVAAANAISLVSADASPITVGGTAPAAAGMSAGIGGAYRGASFAQDATKSSGSVTIDATNNTLEGIRDAINKAAFGVTASIIGDGSAKPYHLVLTSSATGASAGMKISLSGGNPAVTDLTDLLAYDPAGIQNLRQNSSAMSTKATVNGIQVTSESASVSGAIDGVTLTIGAPGKANLMIAKDSAAVTTAVTGFVKGYNDLNNQIKTLSGYNAETKTGGPLLGDSTTQSLQAALRRQMSQAIPGLTGDLTTLSQIGIGFQKDGSLALDQSKLGLAITNNFSGIAALFAAVGKASDSLVSFTSATAATKAGQYAVDITTMASQGAQQTGAMLGNTTIAASTAWTVTLNDTTPSSSANVATIPIRAGTYTPAQMATLLQSAINGASKFSSAGSTATATIEADGSLKVASTRYGSTSNILIADGTGTAVSTLFSGAAPTPGVDVAGTIGGYAATGAGQSLLGSAGGPVEGLKLAVTGGATGSRGTLDFSQGYAYQLNNMAAGFLGAKGIITARTAGINQTIKDIAAQTDTFNTRLAATEKRYRAQYTALDTMIASMNTTTSFLTQQLASIAANK